MSISATVFKIAKLHGSFHKPVSSPFFLKKCVNFKFIGMDHMLEDAITQ